MAYNAAGPGPESERFLERTFKLRPQKPPTAVQVSDEINIKVTVHNAQCNDEEMVVFPPNCKTYIICLKS